jgi:trans-aconitate methyltransferase
MSSTDLGELFSAGRHEFANWSPLLWAPLGAELVGVSRPKPGERVLDLCCGAGASALPAAMAVGPTGQVDAIDLATGLLELGRSEAVARGLGNVRFHAADATTWQTGGYDVVQCGYGVFFLPDMDAEAARLAGLLRPGGRFAVSTWRHVEVDPMMDAFAEAMRPERDTPQGEDEGPVVKAAKRLNRPDKLGAWLTSLGLTDVTVTEIDHQVTVTGELAWDLILGSGFRAALNGLDEAAIERVRKRYTAAIEGTIDTMEAPTLLGVGTRGTS